MSTRAVASTTSACDTYKKLFFEPFLFSRRDSTQKSFEVGNSYLLRTPPSCFANVIVDIIVQYCSQHSNPLVIGMSSGPNVFMSDSTTEIALPDVTKEVMAAGRVKHVNVENISTLCALLHTMKKSVAEKHVLLVLYGLIPLIEAQTSSAIVGDVFRLLHEFATECLAVVVWITSDKVTAKDGPGPIDTFSVSWNKTFSPKSIVIL